MTVIVGPNKVTILVAPNIPVDHISSLASGSNSPKSKVLSSTRATTLLAPLCLF